MLTRALRSLLLGLVVALAAGCAGRTTSRRPEVLPPQLETTPAPANAERPYTVSVKNLDEQGITWFLSRRIDLATRLLEEREVARHVAAHELGHVLGAKHIPTFCIMASRHGAGEPAILSLNPEEIRQTRDSADRTIPIVADASVPPMIYEALTWGCALWNATYGREVLQLSRAP